MSVRKALLILCGAIVILAVLAVVAAPIITTTALKLWIAKFARQNNCSISYGAIDAPLLRPVTLHNLQMATADKAVILRIARIDVSFRIAALVDSSRGRALRNLSLSGVEGECRAAPSPQALQLLIADNFTIAASRFAIHSETVNFEIQDAALTANELQPGIFQARRLVVQSPAFRHAFDNLRGGTSWEYNRLTIGGVTMMRGLDVDVLRLDLGRLSDKRIAVEADLDAFGGKLRASMSAEEAKGKRSWQIAASGSEISLGRMSEALEFSIRASGSLHALKVTFRGRLDRVLDATASLWTEISGFTWRDRRADTVMLGASYYDREINVEQLYVKQRHNELTLSGEFALPHRAGDLPDLRGDVSATVGDLADLARLFGGDPADFAGQLAVNGSATAQEHKLAGQLVVSGKSLKVFGAPIDAIDGSLSLTRSTLEMDHCELRRDSAGLPPLSIRGNCDFADPNAVSARLQFDQPLVLTRESSGCVTEVRLADSPPPSVNGVPFTTLEFSGRLFHAGWAVTAGANGEASAQTFPFCGQRDETGSALVIAPLR